MHLALSLVLLCCYTSESGSTDYWLTTDMESGCPQNVLNSHCVTLSDLVSNSTKYFSSNTMIHLLSGEHIPTQSGWITARGLRNVSIIGNEHNTSIKCVHFKIGFIFEDISPLTLENLKLEIVVTVRRTLLIFSTETIIDRIRRHSNRMLQS